MKFYQSWILRRAVLIIPFLMTGIHFNIDLFIPVWCIPLLTPIYNCGALWFLLFLIPVLNHFIFVVDWDPSSDTSTEMRINDAPLRMTVFLLSLILREHLMMFWMKRSSISLVLDGSGARITSCATYYVRTKRNSSESQNFLTDYLNLVLSKSKELEEVIYSDILNNLGTVVRTKNTETEAKGENKKKEIIKAEKTTSSNRSEIGKLEHFRGPFHNVYLAVGAEQFKFRNVTSSGFERFLRDGYLLGYSGNPFGSHKLIAGVAELENDQGDKEFDPRKKRSVLHLYNMVMCSTGCSPFSYKGYGCYCGFLGSGFVVDGIDSCCKMHDWCYNSAGCPMFLEYFIPYLWKCYHRQPLCAINPGYYNGPGSCSQRLCECDRQLALCLRKYPCPTSKALCTSSPWRLLQNVLML